MAPSEHNQRRLNDLRRRAERQIEGAAQADPALPTGEVTQLLRDCLLYQTELELQNQDLLRAEQELTDSRDRYATLYESTPAGHATLGPRGVVIDANRRLGRILGQPRDELLGRPFESFIQAHDQGTLRDLLRVARTSETPQLGRFRVGQGLAAAWIEVHALGPGPQTRDHATMQVAVLDVTAHHLSEVRSAALEQQVRQSQKLESLGDLAGGLAHDFNNLLQAIFSSTELAREAIEEDSSAAPHLDGIEHAGLRAADLAARMLACSGHQPTTAGPVNVGETVREAARLVEVSFDRNIEFRLDLAENLPLVSGDATQLFQIFVNLLTNAADAIGGRAGTISARTTAIGIHPSVVRCWQPELNPADSTSSLGELDPGQPQVHIEIADDGCGMDRETVRRIFDPFFTTKFTGRGLGLATALGIVRGHGGAIHVYSRPEVGTRFLIRLPAGSAAEARAQDADQIGPMKAVLVVAGDESALDLTRNMVRLLGLEAIVTRDATSAVLQCTERGGSLACAILDTADGAALGQQIRQVHGDLPIVLCGDKDPDPAAMGPATVFLRKPVSLPQLRTALEQAMANRT